MPRAGRHTAPLTLALGAFAILAACSSTTIAPATTGTGGSSTGGLPNYLDSGTCLNNYCAGDQDCCLGFACNIGGTCCELPTSSIQCLLDSDCCPIATDAGSSLPYCNINGQCIVAPNCAQINSPCVSEACCPQTGGEVICNPVNQVCAYASATTGAGSTSSSGSSGTSGGSGASTGTSGGAGTSGTTGTGGSQTTWDFSWTFGVQEACEQAGVSWVEVQLTGDAPLLFPCRSPFGNEGGAAPAPPLTQSIYTVIGYDASGGTQLAEATGTTPTALGPTPVPVNLPLADGGGSTLDLSWSFQGQSCAQAGVTQVQLGLQDPNNPALDVNETVACASAGLQGIALKGYGRGQFPMTLSASGFDAGYQATASVSANGSSDSLVQVDLLPSSTATSGEVLVNFDFGGEGCLAAGLDSVGLQLSTIRGTALATAIVLGCDAGASYLFSDVPAPATAFLWVEGISQGQVQQLSNVQVVVSPGGTATYSVVTQLGN